MARDPMLPLRLKMMEQGYTQKQLCGEICDTLNIPMEQIADYFPRRWKA